MLKNFFNTIGSLYFILGVISLWFGINQWDDPTLFTGFLLFFGVFSIYMAAKEVLLDAAKEVLLGAACDDDPDYDELESKQYLTEKGFTQISRFEWRHPTNENICVSFEDDTATDDNWFLSVEDFYDFETLKDLIESFEAKNSK